MHARRSGGGGRDGESNLGTPPTWMCNTNTNPRYQQKYGMSHRKRLRTSQGTECHFKNAPPENLTEDLDAKPPIARPLKRLSLVHIGTSSNKEIRYYPTSMIRGELASQASKIRASIESEGCSSDTKKPSTINTQDSRLLILQASIP